MLEAFCRAIGPLAIMALSYVFPCPTGAEPIEGRQPQTVKEQFRPEVSGYKVEVWTRRLEIPWSLVFLPDGQALVSERPGRIRMVAKDGTLAEAPYAALPVRAQGEGGLMGLALHPDFARQPFIYAMMTVSEGGKVINRVVRMRHGAGAAIDKVIVDDIPGATYHNGGRIAFGPDGMLYVTTGENFQAELAQDLKSLGGKILRVTPEGAVPADNPFPGSPVWSYGHRNPQGLAWHPETKELFISEHGPSGEFGRRKDDEINIVRKGGNYGWPRVVGAAGLKDYVDPVLLWRETGAPPSGIAFFDGSLFVATQRSDSLIRVDFDRKGEDWTVKSIERWFSDKPDSGKWGAFRDAVVGPDGALYALTNFSGGDDKILRITRR
ncbi:MAG: PQQ-dependent sugar dehydrogenase [Alphaproteobacteria bacterium]|nr:PQQ-dependent sugar dehydrogenase [Alphaproteobacteria bacterium]